MPRRKSLRTITERLGKNYDRWKRYEKKKDENRDEFFEAATLAAADQTLATQTVAISPARPYQEARDYLEKYYPRWKVVGTAQEDGLVVKAALEERPEFKTFPFVNEKDGRVYTRQVDNGPAMLDDDRLQLENPELYEAVTFRTPWDEVLIWPLDKLSEELQAQVQDYVYTGKPKVKLAAPRRAKPEELGEE